MRLQFDRTSRAWCIQSDASGPRHFFDRVILDAPATSSVAGGFVLADDTGMSYPAQSTLHLFRGGPPGKPKAEEMREWCVVQTEHEPCWLVYRHDDKTVSVTADVAELDCHGITTGDGVLHCNAEMLVHGHTNRVSSFERLDVVRLRTLSEYEQTIGVPVMASRFMNTQLG